MLGVWQNLGNFIVSDEASEVSAWHAKLPDDVRELWVPDIINSNQLSVSLLSFLERKCGFTIIIINYY